jgi:co-chaperonin GroES (HSP10)
MIIKPLRDKIFGVILDVGEITTKAGVILQSDVGKEGRPRWFKVEAVGPEATEVKNGDYVLVDTGRWSYALKRLSDGVELRDIEYDGILAVANKDNMPSELQQLLLKNG